MTCIYALFDPAAPEENRYVGVTVQQPDARLKTHIQEALRRSQDGGWKLPVNHRRAWIRALVREGRRPEVRVLAEVQRDVRKAEERLWIAEIRRLGHRLTNATDGGEGPEHYKPADAAKIRNSIAQKVRYSDPAEVERSRALTLAKWKDTTYRQRVVDGLTAAWSQPGRREEMSTKIREYRADPVRSAGHAEATRAFYATERGRDSARRRALPGESNPQARLAWPAVRDIRGRYAAGGVSQRALAAEFGVTQTLISQIVRGVIWRDEADEPAVA